MTTEPNADTVVRAIVELARSLHLDVVAEGVEAENEADALLALGCATAQGYHFSRPLPAPDLELWLAARARQSELDIAAQLAASAS
jgi:EAL domain-containing protein (putative c-di-GMP-specific phosphodiesterase class I)